MATTRINSGPFTVDQVDRFTKALDYSGYDHKFRGVDKRFLTVSPTLVGFLIRPRIISGEEARRVLGDSIGTWPKFGIANAERLRTTVLLDFVTRSALPMALEMLPAWADRGKGGHDAANALRAMTPMMWPSQFVAALQSVHHRYCVIETEARDNGTSDERERHHAIIRVVRAQLDAMSLILPTWLSQAHCDADDYCSFGRRLEMVMDAMVVLDSFEAHRSESLRAGLRSALILARKVKFMDSQQSVADHCVWPRPKASKAKAA